MVYFLTRERLQLVPSIIIAPIIGTPTAGNESPITLLYKVQLDVLISLESILLPPTYASLLMSNVRLETPYRYLASLVQFMILKFEPVIGQINSWRNLDAIPLHFQVVLCALVRVNSLLWKLDSSPSLASQYRDVQNCI